MSRPSFGGRVPLIPGGVVESTIATGPFRKIGKGFLIEEPKVVV